MSGFKQSDYPRSLPLWDAGTTFNVMGVGFLILTVYFICVIYVLYQMALSVEAKLENQFKIALNFDELKEQLTKQLQQQDLYRAEPSQEIGTRKIKDKEVEYEFLKITFFQQDKAVGSIDIEISPMGKRPLEPGVEFLTVDISNGLIDGDGLIAEQVFVNWDYSAISLYGGPAERVIRQIPGQPIDLFNPQVVTVVNPGLKAQASITSESFLRRAAAEQTTLETRKPLVDFHKILDMKEPQRQYIFQMMMWVRSIRNPNGPALQLLIPFFFRIEVLPDHVALPVLSWLLNFNPFSLAPLQKSR